MTLPIQLFLNVNDCKGIHIVVHGAGKESDQYSSIDKYLRSYLQAEANATPFESECSETEYDPNGPPGTKLSTQGSVKLKWENHWKRFTTVINSKVLRIWGHLEQGLTAYHKLLKERYACVSHQ